MFGAMLASAKMVLNHLKGILAHWKEKITNAFMEGLNSVFSATKRRARGYRSSVHLIAIGSPPMPISPTVTRATPAFTPSRHSHLSPVRNFRPEWFLEIFV